jgi:acetylornithine deacetylase/succinyl-diaminopimelate desuccinylase-like protein
MDKTAVETFVNTAWDESIIPKLVEFIKIPNKSPMFDADWKAHGYMDQAVALIKNWCETNAPKNMVLEVLELEGRTPLIFMDIPGEIDDTILLYGHLDKQPEMEGWDDDLGPWKPVLKGEKLYGRGGADDGYAAFASLTAINALQKQGIPHARCVVLIEASEESGSPDLPYYIDALKDNIGTPSLVICLDSGCGNYEQLWSTTSLRGIVGGTLSVQILTEGLHSGAYSGIAASSFRIARELLDRIENKETGEILINELHSGIPSQRFEQTKQAALILGDSVYNEMPFVTGALPMHTDVTELLLNRSWRPTLSVTGADGLPSIANAGNVLRPKTSLKLSFRISPTVDPEAANAVIKRVLEENPPYHAKVTYKCEDAGPGWNAPEVSEWLKSACDKASNNFFGKPCAYMGEGGSIPFMGMLGEKFPEAQFLITGVLGPHSNAHGPNEFLHLTMGKKVTACVSQIIAEHYLK